MLRSVHQRISLPASPQALWQCRHAAAARRKAEKGSSPSDPQDRLLRVLPAQFAVPFLSSFLVRQSARASHFPVPFYSQKDYNFGKRKLYSFSPRKYPPVWLSSGPVISRQSPSRRRPLFPKRPDCEGAWSSPSRMVPE